MEKHALAFLKEAESWNFWSDVSDPIQNSGKFRAKLLSGFIAESQQLVKNLKQTEFFSSNHSELVLFEGLDRRTIDFRPVFEMAAELFTHLCVAFMNPGGLALQGFGIQEQTALKTLLFERDGFSCPLTGAPFDIDDGVDPILVPVIPNSVDGKPDTVKYIAMLAGAAVRDLVLQQMNDLGNFMNLQLNAHTAYHQIRWAIEGQDKNGEIEYIYRRVPHSTMKGPGYIRFRDGDRTAFGRGPDAARLGSGPNPLLCNLQLAVARVLQMSGAAEVIARMIEDGDDSDFSHVYIASPPFCDILTAKLLLSGRALG